MSNFSKEHAEELLAKSRLRQLLDYLAQYAVEDEHQQEIPLLKGKLTLLEKEERRGVLSIEEQSLKRSKLMHDCSTMIELVSESHGVTTKMNFQNEPSPDNQEKMKITNANTHNGMSFLPLENKGQVLKVEILEKLISLPIKSIEMEFRKKSVEVLFGEFKSTPSEADSFTQCYCSQKVEQLMEWLNLLEATKKNIQTYGANNPVLFRRFAAKTEELAALVKGDGINIIAKSKHECAVSLHFEVNRYSKNLSLLESTWDTLVRNPTKNTHLEREVIKTMDNSIQALGQIVRHLHDISGEIISFLN